MEDMYRLDFSRGTVEKIDSRTPPRGWQDARSDTGQEATRPVRTGYILMVQGLGPRIEREENDED